MRSTRSRRGRAPRRLRCLHHVHGILPRPNADVADDDPFITVSSQRAQRAHWLMVFAAIDGVPDATLLRRVAGCRHSCMRGHDFVDLHDALPDGRNRRRTVRRTAFSGLQHNACRCAQRHPKQADGGKNFPAYSHIVAAVAAAERLCACCGRSVRRSHAAPAGLPRVLSPASRRPRGGLRRRIWQNMNDRFTYPTPFARLMND